LFLTLLLTQLAVAGCDLAAPPDAPFATRRVEAERARLMVEVWVSQPEQVPWARQVLGVMEAHDAPATLVVPLRDGPEPELEELMSQANAAGHQLALAMRRADVPTDVLASVRPLKKRARAYEPSGRIRTVAAALGGRGSEAMLGKVGFRSLLQLEAAAGATARLAGQFEGQPRVNVVFPPGAYRDDCGPDPLVGPFTPKAADRAMEAVLQGSTEATPTPVVRLALDGSRASDSDAAVLGRWLDEVVVPAGVTLATAEGARSQVLQGFKSGPVTDAERRATGRLVPVAEVRQAAEELSTLDELPLSFDNGLNPTELFVALLLINAGEVSEDSVRLRSLRGPASQPPPRSNPVTLEADAVKRTAGQLLAALPDELPAALPVSGELLSAAELLTAMASALRGDEPVQARPVASPDPHARGLGWGVAE